MSEHKAYDELVAQLQETAAEFAAEKMGIRAAIALAYLEVVSYKDRSKASRISML